MMHLPSSLVVIGFQLFQKNYTNFTFCNFAGNSNIIVTLKTILSFPALSKVHMLHLQIKVWL